MGARARSRVWRTAVVAVLVVAGAGAWMLGADAARREPAALPPPRPVVSIPAGAPSTLTTLLPSTPVDPDAPGLGGEALVLTPDGRSLLSADGPGRLSVFDLPSAALRTVPAGEARVLEGNRTGLRHDVAAGPDSRLAYLTDGFAQAVRVVELSTGAVVATVAVPAPPTAVAATPDGRHLEVADTTGALTTVDTTTRAVTGSRRVAPVGISALTVTRDGRRLVAVTTEPTTLTVVDTGDTRVGPSRTVTVPSPASASGGAGVLAVDPDGRRAYVATAKLAGGPPVPGDGVTVIDLDAAAVVTTLPAPRAAAVAVSPDGRLLHLARTPEVETVAGPEPDLVIETRDIAADYRPIGAADDPISTYGATPLQPSPDGRHLYTTVNGTVVDLT